jgi:hypothetical protein
MNRRWRDPIPRILAKGVPGSHTHCATQTILIFKNYYTPFQFLAPEDPPGLNKNPNSKKFSQKFGNGVTFQSFPFTHGAYD